MTKVTVITRAGSETLVEGEAGQSLMEALRDAGIDGVQALCGGCCACGTCHVYVDASPVHDLPEIGADEDGLLDGLEHRRAESRLSCQLRIGPSLNGLRIVIAPEG